MGNRILDFRFVIYDFRLRRAGSGCAVKSEVINHKSEIVRLLAAFLALAVLAYRPVVADDSPAERRERIELHEPGEEGATAAARDGVRGPGAVETGADQEAARGTAKRARCRATPADNAPLSPVARCAALVSAGAVAGVGPGRADQTHPGNPQGTGRRQRLAADARGLQGDLPVAGRVRAEVRGAAGRAAEGRSAAAVGETRSRASPYPRQVADAAIGRARPPGAASPDAGAGRKAPARRAQAAADRRRRTGAAARNSHPRRRSGLRPLRPASNGRPWAAGCARSSGGNGTVCDAVARAEAPVGRRRSTTSTWPSSSNAT